MIKTQNLILSPSDIPSEWAFSHLLGVLSLNGSDIKIRSPFSEDRTPSFSIYKKSGDKEYKYFCFSSGIGGDATDLYIRMQALKGVEVSRQHAFSYFKEEFKLFLQTGQYINPDSRQVFNSKAKITQHELRKWNKDDLRYWSEYEIELPILEKFNVSPVKSFTMEKLVEGELKKYEFEHPRIFAYYRKDGSLERLYRPGNKIGKFIKVGGVYSQGSDQIGKPKKNLFYIKSLKDIMAWETLDIPDWDLKAPSSENVMIPTLEVEADKAIYDRILVYMDPDPSGLKAMAKYKEKHNLESFMLDMMGKDLSDNIKFFSSTLTRLKVMQLL